MDIKGLFFDNDGVITYTEHVFFHVNKKVFDSLNIPYTKKDFVEHTFNTGLGSSGWIKNKGYGADIIENFTQLRDLAYREIINKTQTTEFSAKPLLATLKKDYLLCIVTNTRKNMFQYTHEKDGLYQLFAETVCREDYVNTKPAPDSYLVALEKTKLHPHEVLVIEDSPRGIQAAQAAGIKVIAITNPHFPNLNTDNAEYHITSLTELPDLLKSLHF